MAAFRYATDFEQDSEGDFFAALAKTGASENFPRISTLSGKKVATAVGFYTPGTSCRSWQEITQLATNAAGKDIGDGWLVQQMRYRHVSNAYPIVIGGLDTASNYVMKASLEVDPGDNHFYFRVKQKDGEELYVDQDLGFAADDQYHNFEIRLSKTVVAIKHDGTLRTFDVPVEWQPYQMVKFYTFVNGWAYISWYGLFVTQRDVYTADDPELITVDGVGVASAAVKLFNTDTKPPDFEITSGVGGAIDYSGVDDGTYLVVGLDAFGYAFYAGEIEIASGEPV